MAKNKVFVITPANQCQGGSTPPFVYRTDAYKADHKDWADEGDKWLGGTLKGLKSKIGYLKRLGVTTVWISPVFKQVEPDKHSCYGYGIQNFLDIDPHFGTRKDLRDLVDTAHANGIYVILDIIFNHTGDVFGYQPDRYLTKDKDGNEYIDPRWDGRHYQVSGYRNAYGQANIAFSQIDMQSNTSAWVTIDNDLHCVYEKLNYIYSTDKVQIGERFDVEVRSGKAVYICVPPGGLVIVL